MSRISHTIPGALTVVFALSLAAMAQAQPLPPDLVQISPSDAAALSVGRLFRMSSYPNNPPLPPAVLFVIPGLGPDGTGPLDPTSSATNCGVYFSASVQAVFVDDRQAVTEQALAQAAMDGNRLMSEEEDGDGGDASFQG